MEKRQESFYAFFPNVQHHLIEQHGMKTTSLECLIIHIYIGCHVLSSSMPVTVVYPQRINSFPLTAHLLPEVG